MSFLGIGPLEIMLVLVIGVIVLGPERTTSLVARVAHSLWSRLVG